jgi:hypothetical protein
MVLAGKDGCTTSEFGFVADQADRREILARIVAGVFIERRADAQRAGVTQHDGVAIGRALRHRLGADGAAGPGPVVDDDLFTQRLAHLVGDHAAHDRGAAARRERNHQRDRPVRIGLCLRRNDKPGQSARGRGKQDFPDTHVGQSSRDDCF